MSITSSLGGWHPGSGSRKCTDIDCWNGSRGGDKAPKSAILTMNYMASDSRTLTRIISREGKKIKPSPGPKIDVIFPPFFPVWDNNAGKGRENQ